MRLTDLQPCWIVPGLFIFKSPTGAGDWLIVKNYPFSTKQQLEFVYEKRPDLVGQCVVPAKVDFCWNINHPGLMEEPDSESPQNAFKWLTVTPSVDHSPSGNWHGFITNGEIR
jgi:hypothetical protein